MKTSWKALRLSSAIDASVRKGAPILLSILFASCESPDGMRCAAGERPAVGETLYFGTARPDGAVTADEWASFVSNVVTPRFPDGLTVVQATGQWRGADGVIVRESTYVLQLLHPADASLDGAITELIAAYKSRFRQESVLRVRTRTCMSL